MKRLLIKLEACESALKWAGDKSWPEIYSSCHKAEWLIWLFTRTNPNDLRLRVLVAGHCANAVRHLMNDERSIAAVDAAIAFGEGRIDEDELNTAAAAAYSAAYAAAYSAYAASAYAAYAASAAYADRAACSARAAYATDASESKHQAMMADIVRKHIPIETFNIKP